MKGFTKAFLILLSVLLLLSGCGKAPTTEPSDSAQEGTAAPINMDFAKTAEEMFTRRDTLPDYDERSFKEEPPLSGDSSFFFICQYSFPGFINFFYKWY